MNATRCLIMHPVSAFRSSFYSTIHWMRKWHPGKWSRLVGTVHARGHILTPASTRIQLQEIISERLTVLNFEESSYLIYQHSKYIKGSGTRKRHWNLETLVFLSAMTQYLAPNDLRSLVGVIETLGDAITVISAARYVANTLGVSWLYWT